MLTMFLFLPFLHSARQKEKERVSEGQVKLKVSLTSFIFFSSQNL
jgi:hypothetical protein